MRDPYDVLGVSPTATDDDIKAAYRKLAKKYHPDLNGGSAEAEAKMKEVNEAYTILIKHKDQRPGDSDRSSDFYGRSSSYGGYDSYRNQYGNQTYSGQSSGNPFADFGFDFEEFFGGSRNRYTAYKEKDPQLQRVESSVLAGYYDEALRLLSSIYIHKAAWYYWSARANAGLGNRITAIKHAQMAAEQAPEESAFQQLVNELNASGNAYRTRRTQGDFFSSSCCFPLLSLFCANAFCNICCLGGRGGCFC